MAKVYDALIIGGGPAGLSVALGLGRIHRTCAVFSDSKFRNQGAHHAHSILTRDHTPPETLRAIGRQEVEKYGHAEFFETTLTKVSKGKVDQYDGFIVEDGKGQKWEGRTVVIATGTRDLLPKIPGYAENWPENIYQCPFCDGHERHQLKKAVFAFKGVAPPYDVMASLLHFMGLEPGSGRVPTSPPAPSLVTVYTNGPSNPSSDATVSDAIDTCKAFGMGIDERPIVKLERDATEGMHIHLRNADNTTSSVHVGFAFHRPPGEPVAMDLINQLGLNMAKSPMGPNIEVQLPFHSTNVPGVYACGDITTMAKHTTNAMYGGAMVAGAIAHQCCYIDNAVVLAAQKSQKL